MPQYTIMLTDFGEPDWDLETQVLRESGLDINLVRLDTRVPEQLIPQVAAQSRGDTGYEGTHQHGQG